MCTHFQIEKEWAEADYYFSIHRTRTYISIENIVFRAACTKSLCAENSVFVWRPLLLSKALKCMRCFQGEFDCGSVGSWRLKYSLQPYILIGDACEFAPLTSYRHLFNRSSWLPNDEDAITGCRSRWCNNSSTARLWIRKGDLQSVRKEDTLSETSTTQTTWFMIEPDTQCEYERRYINVGQSTGSKETTTIYD